MSRVHWLFLVFFLLFSIPNHAQEPTSIAGTVQDATGGVVVGATLILTDEKGTVVQTVATSQTGEYMFAGLPPETYTITATAAGFNDLKLRGLSVAAGQALRKDLTLAASTVVTQTTVEGQSGANVETEQSQISGTITQKELIKIGLNGRNFTQLIALAPGPGTAAALAAVGIVNVRLPATTMDSEGLLALPELSAVAGKRVVIFRGGGGREDEAQPDRLPVHPSLAGSREAEALQGGQSVGADEVVAERLHRSGVGGGAPRLPLRGGRLCVVAAIREAGAGARRLSVRLVVSIRVRPAFIDRLPEPRVVRGAAVPRREL